MFDERERAANLKMFSARRVGRLILRRSQGGAVRGSVRTVPGCAVCDPTSSGTTALEVALKALEVGPGDEVIVPAITFAATAYAPLTCNARPVFADVDAETICMDPASVQKLITPRTRASSSVHYGASLADLDALQRSRGQHSIAHCRRLRTHARRAVARIAALDLWRIGCFSFPKQPSR